MKHFHKILILIPAAILMYIIDVPPQPQQFPYFQLVSEAHAVFGVRRRSLRRGVIIGSSMAAAGASTAAVSQQQAATAQQQSATAQQQSATAQQQSTTAQQQSASTAAASAAGNVPLGTVVNTLPGGCKAVTVGGAQYQDCTGSFYKAAFQGNNLVYVVVESPL